MYKILFHFFLAALPQHRYFPSLLLNISKQAQINFFPLSPTWNKNWINETNQWSWYASAVVLWVFKSKKKIIYIFFFTETTGAHTLTVVQAIIPANLYTTGGQRGYRLKEKRTERESGNISAPPPISLGRRKKTIECQLVTCSTVLYAQELIVPVIRMNHH